MQLAGELDPEDEEVQTGLENSAYVNRVLDNYMAERKVQLIHYTHIYIYIFLSHY